MPRLTRLSAAALCAAFSFAASAQGYPTKPVKIIVPYTAGGSSDFTARTLAEKMGPLLGGQVCQQRGLGRRRGRGRGCGR